MARRHVDDQSADPALAHRGELPGHQLEVPVRCKRDARVELAKSARRKARKIDARAELNLPPGRNRRMAQGQSPSRDGQPSLAAGFGFSESDPFRKFWRQLTRRLRGTRLAH